MADEILHNLSIDNNPSDSVKIAMGTETTPATNITLANFYTLLMSKLGFFKVSNLFSEIFGNSTAMAAARANISTPSVLEMKTADNLRALKTNVIEKDSTSSFTPSLPTHPVNLKVITDKFPASGTYQWAEGSMGNQVSTQQIAIGKTLPNTNYQVVFTKISGINSNVPSPQVNAKGLSTFNIQCYANGGNGGNPTWDWYIIMR